MQNSEMVVGILPIEETSNVDNLMLASDVFRSIDGWINRCIVSARWLRGGRARLRYIAFLK